MYSLVYPAMNTSRGTPLTDIQRSLRYPLRRHWDRQRKQWVTEISVAPYDFLRLFPTILFPTIHNDGVTHGATLFAWRGIRAYSSKNNSLIEEETRFLLFRFPQHRFTPSVTR